MRVALTSKAEADLESIGDWIARDNPAKALTFVEELRAAIKHLGQFPKAYPVVERYADKGVRKHLIGAYIAFYRVESDRVLVLRVLHGARDWARVLDSEI